MDALRFLKSSGRLAARIRFIATTGGGILSLLAASSAAGSPADRTHPERSRVVIMADMGNEPDEEQQMIHLLLYANEIELEALIAVSGRHLHSAHQEPAKRTLRPDLLHRLIDGYSSVFDNLSKHAAEYPAPQYLRSIVSNGQPDYGIEGTGEGRSSDGSSLLLRIFERSDPRPIYIVVNAGSNTLVQALQDFERDHGKAALEPLIRKLRVYENGAQDNAGAWICVNYPGIHWLRSGPQTNAYGGPGGDSPMGPHAWGNYPHNPLGQHQWALEHIIGGHGALGALYPIRVVPGWRDGSILFIEGGGTTPWLGLVNKGLWDVEHPHQGGWGGRFTRAKVKNPWSRYAEIRKDEESYGDFHMFVEDSDEWLDPATQVLYRNPFAPVWRFRGAAFNDFRCRMDWCLEAFADANHNPVAVVNGDALDDPLFLSPQVGDAIVLDASASRDPDGDALGFRWWIYPEAGTYAGDLFIDDPECERLSWQVPPDAAGTEIHIILEVRDHSRIAPMFDYRRVVLQVSGRFPTNRLTSDENPPAIP